MLRSCGRVAGVGWDGMGWAGVGWGGVGWRGVAWGRVGGSWLAAQAACGEISPLKLTGAKGW